MKSVEFANFLTKGMGKAQAFAKIQYGNFVNSISFYTESACFILRILSTWQICKNDILSLDLYLKYQQTSLFGLFWRKIYEEKKVSIFWPKWFNPISKI